MWSGDPIPGSDPQRYQLVEGWMSVRPDPALATFLEQAEAASGLAWELAIVADIAVDELGPECNVRAADHLIALLNETSLYWPRRRV